MSEELEDPAAEDWSTPTILDLLSQAKNLSREVIGEGVDIEAYTATEFQLPTILAELSQNFAPLPPALWLSRVRRRLCVLLEKSIWKGKEQELKFKTDLSHALSLSSKVKIDPIESRAGFLVLITQYTNLKRTLSDLQLPDWHHILFKLAKESLKNPFDQRFCTNMLDLKDLERYLMDNSVINLDMVGDLLEELVHGCPDPDVRKSILLITDAINRLSKGLWGRISEF